MRVISSLAPIRDEKNRHHLVFDTIAGDRSLVVAIIQSADGGQHVSELGQHTLDLASRHYKAQHGDGTAHLVPVMAASVARKKAIEVFEAADPGSLVLFFGANDSVCAALVKVLGVSTAASGVQ